MYSQDFIDHSCELLLLILLPLQILFDIFEYYITLTGILSLLKFQVSLLGAGKTLINVTQIYKLFRVMKCRSAGI